MKPVQICTGFIFCTFLVVVTDLLKHLVGKWGSGQIKICVSGNRSENIRKVRHTLFFLSTEMPSKCIKLVVTAKKNCHMYISYSNSLRTYGFLLEHITTTQLPI